MSQAYSDKKLATQEESFPSPDDHGMVSRQKLLTKLKIGAVTLDKWIKHGLEPVNVETKQDYFIVSEVWQFMVSNRRGLGLPKVPNHPLEE